VQGEVWCYLGATLLTWSAKKGTIRPWAGEWLWGFKFQKSRVLSGFGLPIFIWGTEGYRATTKNMNLDMKDL
jgi:hypothetical protein